MNDAEVIHQSLVESGLLAADEQQWNDAADAVLDALRAAGYAVVAEATP